ncbi:fatty acid hydroxylase [beta proteobacterium AAP99]|nr:fatty acid hydroxylase [beta proteobacterium AAP99]
MEVIQQLVGGVTEAFTQVQAWLFTQLLAPLMHALGLSAFIEDGFDATEWFLLGGLEVLLLFALLRPLEKLLPAETEPATAERRRAIRTDFLYTLLHRLGGFSLLMFFVLTPIADGIEGELRLAGVERWTLDTVLPWLGSHALLQFAVYLLILDFVDYWIHRGQHSFNRWWALHALHHSARHMTLWSDNRNHLLDDALRDTILVALALVIGVEPAQFIGLIIASRVMQSLSHANVRLRFGPLRWLLVSPQFHRRHHAIGVGHEGAHQGVNFGVLFSFWDVLFRTADFTDAYEPTGIRDQLTGREYGQGFWAQQWLGCKRLLGLRGA